MKIIPLPEKYKNAITILYEQNGVGETYKAKRAFWNTYRPCHISHVETDKQWVKVCEMTYLADLFPSEFGTY